MKLNQQTAALALCTLLGVSVLAGCGRSGDFSELQPAVNKIEYTNLNDSGSRELLKELLSDAGVSDGRIQSFFRRAAEKRGHGDSTCQAGFAPSNPLLVRLYHTFSSQ